MQAKRGYEDAPYVATQKKPNHATHQGSGTRSPQVLTALSGSAVLFGPTAGGKNKWKTGQGVSAANFLPATRKPTHEPHHGSGTRSPQVSAALFSLAALFGLTVEENFQGKTRQGVSTANFLPAQGSQYKKEANSPWGPRAETQPPSRGGVVYKKPGENWSGRKRCRFSTGRALQPGVRHGIQGQGRTRQYLRCRQPGGHEDPVRQQVCPRYDGVQVGMSHDDRISRPQFLGRQGPQGSARERQGGPPEDPGGDPPPCLRGWQEADGRNKGGGPHRARQRQWPLGP